MRVRDAVIPAVGVFVIYTLCIVSISIFFPELSKSFFPHTEIGIYNKSFWDALLINANASIIDFFVIGIIVVALNAYNGKRSTISELYRDLEDYAAHSSVDINLKKLGIIKRLNKANIYIVNVQRMSLDNKILIKKLTFQNSDLTGLNFTDSSLSETTFTDCNLRSLSLYSAKVKSVIFSNCKIKRMKLNNAKLLDVVFNDSDLNHSDFTNSELKSCMFKNCNMENINFSGANMRSANIRKCRNINIEELCKAANLNYLIADSDVIEKIKSIKPEVKFATQRQKT
ncbi:pentapeptide repeat-containing protein [Yersinia enterocolitica]|uniref:pentapeptide repeat-containing protein n=1 Tax=Yersinia enterocolitica TaxID=630 RepID=UPI00227CE703|nr:pentapeptide repeat-containing protein [Yersinia enterocolitica]MCY1685358.1 pentapeptide repeat-containing protein [Yersinia enterocolitica]